MEAQHMNQQTFAQYTGIGSASLSSIFTGRTNPTLKHVDLIIEKFPNVNPMWLLKGQGGMLNINDSNSAENSAAKPNDQNIPEQTSQNGNISDDIFGTANMSVQPSLFDNAVATPSKSSTAQNSTNSQISQNGKRAVNGVQMNFSSQQEALSPTPQRKITEIRIFYDDQTWETFIPKNK